MKGNSGISLFLIELIIMLTVFVAAASIDVLMLVKSNRMAEEGRALDTAVEYAVSAADCYKATGSGEAIGMTRDGDVWTLITDSGCAVTMTENDGCAQIDVSRDGGSVYSLSVKAADYEK